MSVVTSIICVIIMVGILASFHELAHFWTARLLKIKVYEVSLFVGPKLLHWKHKDVDFSVRLIPVGAYVRFNEVDPEGYVVDSDDPSLLANQPRIKRLIVAVAGPLMNLLLGIIIFFGMFLVTGFLSTEIGAPVQGTQTAAVATEYTPGDKILKINGNKIYTVYDLYYELDSSSLADDMSVTLKSKETGDVYDIDLKAVVKKRPMLLITVESMSTDNEYKGWKVHSVEAEQNKGNPVLQEGDYVTHINGVSVADEGFDDYLFSVTDEVLTVTYIRDGVSDDVEIIPEYTDYAMSRGLSLVGYKVDSIQNFFRAFGYAAKMPATMGKMSVRGIKDAIAGKVKAYNLVSGPIGITSMVNDVVKDEEDTAGDKIYTLIMLCAIISIALAFSNLLPIPGLDGVQIILIAVEMVIGRKLSDKAEGKITVIGFVLIILLLIFAFVSDILTIIFGY